MICFINQSLLWMQFTRCQNAKIKSHNSRANHQRICHIVATIANKHQLSSLQFSDMFFNCHEVSQNLCWMELIGQSIPHWNASVTRQFLNSRVIKTAEFNSVKHSTQNLSGIFNRLFLTQLNIIFTEVFRRNSKVISSHRKCAARSR